MSTRLFPVQAWRGAYLLVALVFVGCRAEAQNTTTQNTATKPVSVRLEKTAHGFRLLRGGKPYFIRGAGGDKQLDLLAQFGANSVRTWGAEQLDTVLPQARKHNLSVCAGLWMGHERHGFDYNDVVRVEQQKQTLLQAVEKHKNDPAILLWAVGNEMEGDGKNPRVWQAVNDLARAIKKTDPNHLTITVIAELGEGKIEAFQKYCPDVDILGVNSYGGFGSVATRLRERGYNGPFIVTEWGTLGPWEGGYSPWRAPLEMTSTQKADFAMANYHRTVNRNPEHCLGAYAFLWGHKQERTGTWFGILLPDGSRTQLADELHFVWKGTWPGNRVPQLLSLDSEANNKHVLPSTRYAATVRAFDPENDDLKYEWEVREETSDARSGGDAEAVPPAHPESIVESKGAELAFQTPVREGAYRLFVTVRDGNGGAATANFPFFVRK
jgi:hypothetical protein